jgi:HPt (histidine-containing phosphotransfer) domain-containing protein
MGMNISAQLINLHQLLSFNHEAALERVGGDKELLKEVAELYLGEYPLLLSEIGSAISHRDPDLLQRAAHTLKGSLGTLGADRAHQLARQLEAMGRTGSFQGCETAYEGLKTALEALHRDLEAV